MPKQAHVPARKITAMIYPTVQKPEAAIEIKSVDAAAANRLSDFALQFRRDALVRIDDYHPFMLPGDIFQGPVLFPWEFSVPNELHHPGAGYLGDRCGAI